MVISDVLRLVLMIFPIRLTELLNLYIEISGEAQIVVALNLPLAEYSSTPKPYNPNTLKPGPKAPP